MGWGIKFNADIYLSKQTYENKIDVEKKINELEQELVELECKLKMFASANLKDILPKYWNDDPILWLNNQIDDIFEQIYENHLNLIQIEQYLEYLNNKQKES